MEICLDRFNPDGTPSRMTRPEPRKERRAPSRCPEPVGVRLGIGRPSPWAPQIPSWARRGRCNLFSLIHHPFCFSSRRRRFAPGWIDLQLPISWWAIADRDDGPKPSSAPLTRTIDQHQTHEHHSMPFPDAQPHGRTDPAATRIKTSEPDALPQGLTESLATNGTTYKPTRTTWCRVLLTDSPTSTAADSRKSESQANSCLDRHRAFSWHTTPGPLG